MFEQNDETAKLFRVEIIEDSSRDMYFWFQEKGDDKAKEDLLKKLNETLNQTEPMQSGGIGEVNNR